MSWWRLRKRAGSFEQLMMILRIIFLAVVLLVIVVIVNIGLELQLESKETEALVLMARMMYSPEGISQVDPLTGRVVSGVIDVKNLNDTRLDDGMYVRNNDRISARVEIYTYTDNDDRFVKQVKFMRDLFDAYEPIADAWYNVGGIGGVLKYERTYPVIILGEDGKRELGNVKFKVLIPKGAN